MCRVILCLVFSVLVGFMSMAQESAPLLVQVNMTEVSKGDVLVAIYKNENSWLNQPDIGGEAKWRNNRLIFVADSLSVGKNYAIAVFYDENNNGVLDKNMFGIPIEKYAFGNNAMGMMGPPNFLDASVKIKPADNVCVIGLE